MNKVGQYRKRNKVSGTVYQIQQVGMNIFK